MSEASTWNTSNSGSGFVLVVDSDPQSLVFMSMIIQRLGYHACSALGVGNALEIANASVPSLIISELNLKGLSGLDLLQRLREKPGSSAVPVIIMTRELTLELEQQCRQAGAVACLEKPVQANALYQAIHMFIAPGSRRKDIRIETRLSVSVNDRLLDCVDGECATNLSVNGVYLRTVISYPVNSEVLVNLKLNEQEITAEASVIYCHTPGDGQTGMWGIGLKFLRTSPQAGEIIRRFINDEVAHGLISARE